MLKRRRYRRMRTKQPIRRYRRKSMMLRTMRIYRKRLERAREVKYTTYYSADKAQNLFSSTAVTGDLVANQFTISGLLSNIPQGTGQGQRIGNRIYAKFMTITLFTRSCPSATTYNVGTYQLRAIVSDLGGSRPTAGNAVSAYFNPPVHRNIMGLIDRNTFNVKYDRVYTIQNSWSTTSTLPDAVMGTSRTIKFTVPIGRHIEYKDGSTAVKEDTDYWGLMLLVGVPGMSATLSGYQIACTDIIVRTYYTDA